MRIPAPIFKRYLVLALLGSSLYGCIPKSDFEVAPVDGTYPSENRFLPLNILPLTDVKSFDAYQEQSKVHLAVSGIGALSHSPAIYYLESEDGGKQWSKAQALPIEQLLPINIRGNDVQVAVSGEHIVIVWQVRGEFPNQGPLVSAYSDDGGASWQLGSNPAVNKERDQAYIDLAFDDRGQLHAVWLEDPEENGYQSLRYAASADYGHSWNPAKTLDDSTCSCCWNTLRVDAKGALAILYRDMQPRDMRLLQSFDQGATWTNSSYAGQFNWQFDGCPHIGGSLAIAPDPPKSFYSLAWTGLDSKAGLYFQKSSDHGSSWSLPQLISPQAMHGDLMTDGQNLHLIWDERSAEGLTIKYQYSKNEGQSWSEPRSLSKPTNQASHPKILASAQGGLMLWTEAPNGRAKRLVALSW